MDLLLFLVQSKYQTLDHMSTHNYEVLGWTFSGSLDGCNYKNETLDRFEII